MLLASLFACVSLSLYAQNNGTLSGSVIDGTGALVPNAAVELQLPGGGASILQTKTGAEGVFSIPAVKPGTYDLTVEASGFQKVTLSNVHVDPGRESTLQPIRVDIAGSTQSVEVSDSPITVQSSSYEVATTISAQQVANLPVLDRQVSNLFSTQAGVASNPNGIGSTVIDGLRSQMTNVTLDGINVQDNFIRLGGLDYLPNKFTIAQVAEFTISSANAPSNYGIGATQITMTTPSGTNEVHGSGYYYNRNSALSANNWFSNQNGTEKPFLNLNQMGGTVGGPVKRRTSCSSTWPTRPIACARRRCKTIPFRPRTRAKASTPLPTDPVRNLTSCGPVTRPSTRTCRSFWAQFQCPITTNSGTD